MIAGRVRKNLSCLVSNNSLSYVFESHVSFSRYFSTVSEFLLQKHKFSPQAAAQIASVLTQIKNPEKSDSVISFFKESGFSNTQLEKIVKYRPSFLSSNLEKSIKPKFKIFQDLDFSQDDIAKLISAYPAILNSSINNRVIPSLSILKDLLGSDEEVRKALRISVSFLTKDLEKTLVPNVVFLESCGVPRDQINRVIYSYPRYLLTKPEIIKKCVDKVDNMGVSRDSRMFFHGVWVVCSMSDVTWELKLQAFRNMGFSENDIVLAFRKSPLVFGLSEEKMKEVMKILLDTGKYDTRCIISNPTSFSRSIEKKFKPQLKVLEILESHNLIKRWPSLGNLCTMSKKAFYERYVGPYLDKVDLVYKA